MVHMIKRTGIRKIRGIHKLSSYVKTVGEIDKKTRQKMQRFVLENQFPTKDLGIKSLSSLDKKITEFKKIQERIENDSIVKKYDKLSDKYDKLAGNLEKKRTKEEMKAFKKFFTNVGFWDMHYGRVEAFYVRDKIAKELQKQFPDADWDEIKKIAEEFAEKYRDSKTRYKEYNKDVEKYEKLRSDAWDKQRQRERKLENKYYEDSLIRAYNLVDIQRTITDDEKLRKKYNLIQKKKAEERKRDEMFTKKLARPPKEEVYKKVLGAV